MTRFAYGPMLSKDGKAKLTIGKLVCSGKREYSFISKLVFKESVCKNVCIHQDLATGGLASGDFCYRRSNFLTFSPKNKGFVIFLEKFCKNSN